MKCSQGEQKECMPDCFWWNKEKQRCGFPEFMIELMTEFNPSLLHLKEVQEWKEAQVE
jgi:hypothetical protein